MSSLPYIMFPVEVLPSPWSVWLQRSDCLLLTDINKPHEPIQFLVPKQHSPPPSEYIPVNHTREENVITTRPTMYFKGH